MEFAVFVRRQNAPPSGPGFPGEAGILYEASLSLAAGNWVELPVPADMVSALAQYGAAHGNYLSVTGYSNEASWDNLNNVINFIGKRGSNYPMRHHQFKANQHSWIVFNPDVGPAIHEWGHGYDYNVRDAYSGRLYFKRHPSYDGLSHRIIYYADPPNYAWSLNNKLPLWPEAGGGDVEAQPAFFWEGPMTGIGSLGALVLCVKNGSGGVSFVIYDTQNGVWRANVDVAPPAGKTLSTYEKWGSYSAVFNCGVVILLDSDNNPRAYRLNSNATVTELTAPTLGAGAHSGDPHVGLFTCDPVSGKFLLLNTNGTFWQLDPVSSGAWSQLAGSRTPPAGLVNYGDKNPVAVPIPEYGVICFFSLSYITNIPHMYLYKHGADSGGEGGTIVSEVSGPDTNLAGRSDLGVLWYPTLTDWQSVRSDMSTWDYAQNCYGNLSQSARPQIFYVTAPEFLGNIPTLRFESQSEVPNTLGTGGSLGYVNISGLFKWLSKEAYDHETFGTNGTWAWEGPKNNLYFRYCIMAEASVWDGMWELGMKWPGFQKAFKYNEGIQYSHLWMHHTQPGVPPASPTYDRLPPFDPVANPIYLETYFAGGELSFEQFLSQNWLYPGPNPIAPPRITFQRSGYFSILPNTWYCIEERWKVNSMQPDGTGNYDGEVDVWVNDELHLSLRNMRMRSLYRLDVYDPPSAVDAVYLIIYHGGQNHWPKVPINYRLTAICVADRRIGAPRRA